MHTSSVQSASLPRTAGRDARSRRGSAPRARGTAARADRRATPCCRVAGVVGPQDVVGGAGRQAGGRRRSRSSSPPTPGPPHHVDDGLASRCGSTARHDIAGTHERTQSRRPAAAESTLTAGSARLPTMTGCTNSTATCRACSGHSGATHHSVAPAAKRRASDSAATASESPTSSRVAIVSSAVDLGDHPRSTPLRAPPWTATGRPSLATVRPSSVASKAAGSVTVHATFRQAVPRYRSRRMGDRIDDEAIAALELTEGGVVVGANEAAAAHLRYPRRPADRPRNRAGRRRLRTTRRRCRRPGSARHLRRSVVPRAVQPGHRWPDCQLEQGSRANLWVCRERDRRRCSDLTRACPSSRGCGVCRGARRRR